MTTGFPKEAKGWHRLKGRAAELLKVAKGRHRLQKRVTEILKVAKEHHKVPKDCRGCPREKPKSKSNKGCTKGNLCCQKRYNRLKKRATGSPIVDKRCHNFKKKASNFQEMAKGATRFQSKA